MPHAVINTGPQTGAVTSAGRPLIPGVEPGGSRVGAPTKPALRLIDVNVTVLGLAPDTEDAGQEDLVLYLTLSQESSMVPHLMIPVAHIAFESYQATAVGAVTFQPRLVMNFNAQGTIWCPAYVGWRTLIGGAWGNYDFQIEIDYEMVDIEWMEWFLRWDFLDNTPTGQLEY